jgi:predicted transcriptional regulator
MPKKRSKDMIKAQILALCQEDGANKTRVVYQAGLNFKTVNGYLDLMLEKCLLEASQGDRTIYKTTPDGERALEHHRAIEAIYS